MPGKSPHACACACVWEWKKRAADVFSVQFPWGGDYVTANCSPHFRVPDASCTHGDVSVLPACDHVCLESAEPKGLRCGKVRRLKGSHSGDRVLLAWKCGKHGELRPNETRLAVHDNSESACNASSDDTRVLHLEWNSRCRNKEKNLLMCFFQSCMQGVCYGQDILKNKHMAKLSTRETHVWYLSVCRLYNRKS